MAKNDRSAQAYAKALFEIAKIEDNVEKLNDDLSLVSQNIRSHLRLKSTMYDPKITTAKKKAIVSEIFSEKISPIALNAFNLLIDLNQHSALPEIAEEFSKLANAARKKIIAEAITAVPLTQELSEKLEVKLSELAGKDVVIRSRVDKSIIGGVVVRIGEHILDGSIRHQLKELRERMITAEVR